MPLCGSLWPTSGGAGVSTELNISVQNIPADQRNAVLNESASQLAAIASSAPVDEVLQTLTALGSTLASANPANSSANQAPSRLGECPNDCSGNGVCIVKNPEEPDIKTCNCTEGWHGSECAITTAELEARAALRTTMLSALNASLARSGPIDETFMASAAQSLASVLSVGDRAEISPAMQDAALGALNTLFDFDEASGPSVALSASAGLNILTTLGSVVDSAAGVADRSAVASGSQDFDSATKARLLEVNTQAQNLLVNVMRSLLLDKVAGEPPTELKTPSVSLAVHRATAADMAGSTVNVAGSAAIAVELPSALESLVPSLNGGGLDLHAVSWLVNPYAFSPSLLLSPVASLTLRAAGGAELAMHDLAQPIELTFPLGLTRRESRRSRVMALEITLSSKYSESDAPAVAADITDYLASTTLADNITLDSVLVNETTGLVMIRINCTEFAPPALSLWFQNMTNDDIGRTKWSSLGVLRVQIVDGHMVQAPVCSFWNTTLAEWDTRGCTSKVNWLADPPTVVCSCNHLTDFGGVMADQFVSGNWDVLLNGSIDFNNPAGFITCLTLLGLFTVLAAIALKKDKEELAHLREVVSTVETTQKTLETLYDYHYNQHYTGRISDQVVPPAVLLVMKQDLTFWETFSHKHKFLAPFFGPSANTTSHFNRLLVLLCTLEMQLFISALWYNQAPLTLTLEEQLARGIASVIISAPLGIVIALLFNKSSKARKEVLEFSHFMQQNLAAYVIQRQYWIYRRKRGLTRLERRPSTPMASVHRSGPSNGGQRRLSILTAPGPAGINWAAMEPSSPLSGNVMLPPLRGTRDWQKRIDLHRRTPSTGSASARKRPRGVPLPSKLHLADIVMEVALRAKGLEPRNSVLAPPNRRKYHARAPEDKEANKENKPSPDSFLSRKFVNAETRRTMWPVWLEKLGWGVAFALVAFCSYFVAQFGFTMGDAVTFKWLTSVSTSFASDTLIFSPMKVLILSWLIPKIIKGMKLSQQRMQMIAMVQGDWAAEEKAKDGKDEKLAKERAKRTPTNKGGGGTFFGKEGTVATQASMALTVNKPSPIADHKKSDGDHSGVEMGHINIKMDAVARDPAYVETPLRLLAVGTAMAKSGDSPSQRSSDRSPNGSAKARPSHSRGASTGGSHRRSASGGAATTGDRSADHGRLRILIDRRGDDDAMRIPVHALSLAPPSPVAATQPTSPMSASLPRATARPAAGPTIITPKTAKLPANSPASLPKDPEARKRFFAAVVAKMQSERAAKVGNSAAASPSANVTVASPVSAPPKATPSSRQIRRPAPEIPPVVDSPTSLSASQRV
jgi:hypothetical protein